MLKDVAVQLDVQAVERLYWLGVEKRLVDLVKRLRTEQRSYPAEIPEELAAAHERVDWDLCNLVLHITDILQRV